MESSFNIGSSDTSYLICSMLLANTIQKCKFESVNENMTDSENVNVRYQI